MFPMKVISFYFLHSKTLSPGVMAWKPTFFINSKTGRSGGAGKSLELEENCIWDNVLSPTLSASTIAIRQGRTQQASDSQACKYETELVYQ